MTYCDGENDDREVDPEGDNNTNCQELDQDYGTARLWHTVVRFPNSLGCELGERRVYTRGIELPRPIVKTFFIESGHQGTELISSTQELSIFN